MSRKDRALAHIKFGIWMSFTLVLYKTLKAYEKIFQAMGVTVLPTVKQVLDKLDYSKKLVNSIHVVRVTVKELGFNDFTPISDIINAAHTEFLDELPLSAVYPLRVTYGGQPVGERLYVITKPFIHPVNNTESFAVIANTEEHGKHIDSAPADHERKYGPNDVLLFLPRKLA